MEISEVSMNFPFSRNQTWSPLDRKCGWLPLFFLPLFLGAAGGLTILAPSQRICLEFQKKPRAQPRSTGRFLEIEFPPGPPPENNKKNHAKLPQNPMK